MKFRFVIFSLISLICAQPILCQLTEEEMANLLISSFVEQARKSSRFANYSKEERAERRAELVKQVQKICTQMYSAQQERLLKCVKYGALGAVLIGYIATLSCARYMQYKDLTHQELTAAKELKKYIIDETLLADLNTAWWQGLKMCGVSFAGTIAAALPVGYFNEKLEFQNIYKAKLEDIKKQIAELDALDATEAQNGVASL